MPKRLALYIGDLSRGGAERVVLNLSAEFARRGHDVHLVLDRRGAEGGYLGDVSSDVTLHVLGATKTTLAAPTLAGWLRKHRPDALLAALPHNNITAILARRLSGQSFCLVLSEHVRMGSHVENEGRTSLKFVPLLARILYRFADGIVCVSEGVANDLAVVTGLARSRFQIIPNPIVSDRISMLATAPIPESYEGGTFILGVGRLTAQKDFTTLIGAFAMLGKEMDMRLVILGEGEQRAELEALARARDVADRVLLPGAVENPFAWMSRAAMLVLSSQYEGFGNVLVEAMACGTQVVSTDCPSGPSEILAGGTFGRLVPVADAAALAKAIRATIVGPVTTREALLAHAQEYSVSRIAERYLKILLGAGEAARVVTHQPQG